MTFSGFERWLIKQFTELRNAITAVDTSQRLLTSKVDELMRFTGATSSSIELPDEVQFPLKDMQQLERFELLMLNSQLKPLVVSFLIILKYFWIVCINKCIELRLVTQCVRRFVGILCNNFLKKSNRNKCY